MPEAKPGPKRPLGLQAKMYDNDRPGQLAILVLYICVGFWLLAHLTRDLSQAERKNKCFYKQMTTISLKIVEAVILSENSCLFCQLLSL